MITRYRTKQAARKARTRKRLRAHGSRPRLSVFRSGKHISVQIIDDQKGTTLIAASDNDVQKNGEKMTKTMKATELGTLLAGKAKKARVTKVMFDRGAYRFHGRIKALAEAARKGGLEF